MKSVRKTGSYGKWAGAARACVVKWCVAALLCLAMAVLPGVLLQGMAVRGTDELSNELAEEWLSARNLFGVIDAWASETRVFDGAGLFSRSEIEELEAAIAETRDEAGFDAAVMTTDDAEGKSARMYAADRYDELGLGEGSDHSGVMYLIDMDNREIYLLTTGKAIRILTDDRIDAVLDAAYEEVSNGDYAASAETALENVVYYAKKGVVSGQYNYDEETGRISVYRSVSVIEFLTALIISAVVAGGAAMAVKREYNMEVTPSQLANYNMAYRESSDFRVANHADHLLGTFVTTMLIANAVSNAGHGGHSGGSSGRSTTFHGSSGRSHGGGGRKF